MHLSISAGAGHRRYSGTDSLHNLRHRALLYPVFLKTTVVLNAFCTKLERSVVPKMKRRTRERWRDYKVLRRRGGRKKWKLKRKAWNWPWKGSEDSSISSKIQILDRNRCAVSAVGGKLTAELLVSMPSISTASPGKRDRVVPHAVSPISLRFVTSAVDALKSTNSTAVSIKKVSPLFALTAGNSDNLQRSYLQTWRLHIWIYVHMDINNWTSSLVHSWSPP